MAVRACKIADDAWRYAVTCRHVRPCSGYQGKLLLEDTGEMCGSHVRYITNAWVHGASDATAPRRCMCRCSLLQRSPQQAWQMHVLLPHSWRSWLHISAPHQQSTWEVCLGAAQSSNMPVL